MTATLDDTPVPGSVASGSWIDYRSVVADRSGSRRPDGRWTATEVELERCNQACCANITGKKETVKCSKP